MNTKNRFLLTLLVIPGSMCGMLRNTSRLTRLTKRLSMPSQTVRKNVQRFLVTGRKALGNVRNRNQLTMRVLPVSYSLQKRVQRFLATRSHKPEETNLSNNKHAVDNKRPMLAVHKMLLDKDININWRSIVGIFGAGCVVLTVGTAWICLALSGLEGMLNNGSDLGDRVIGSVITCITIGLPMMLIGGSGENFSDNDSDKVSNLEKTKKHDENDDDSSALSMNNATIMNNNMVNAVDDDSSWGQDSVDCNIDFDCDFDCGGD